MDEFAWQNRIAAGYDTIATRFAGASTLDHVQPWIEQFTAKLPDGARVLDLGCGSGAAERTLHSRFDVVGVDISAGQLRIAAEMSPDGQFVLADMENLQFTDARFNGILALYSIIHVRRTAHPDLLGRIWRWLKPQGRCLLVLGGGDSPVGYEEDRFGAPMFWSHYDAEASLKLVEDAGFSVERWDKIHDPIDVNQDGFHLFVLAQKGTN